MEHFARQRLSVSGGFKLAGEEEENDPAEEAEEYEEVELEDYTSYADTEAVQNELSYRRRTGWIVLALTGILEGLLLWLTVMTFITPALPIDPIWFLSIHLFVLGVMLVLNHRMVGGGLGRAVPAQGRCGQCGFPGIMRRVPPHRPAVCQCRSPCGRDGPSHGRSGGAGDPARSGGQTDADFRICENFRFVSHPGEKYAARLIEDPHVAVEVGRRRWRWANRKWPISGVPVFCPISLNIPMSRTSVTG